MSNSQHSAWPKVPIKVTVTKIATEVITAPIRRVARRVPRTLGIPYPKSTCCSLVPRETVRRRDLWEDTGS